MTEVQQDLFLSHASEDKAEYVEPLAGALKQRGVTFWLDTNEIGLGDNFVNRINEGLRSSRYAAICLSDKFLQRPWPEHEMTAAMALQNRDERKRVVPLILNSRARVLAQYPLIAPLKYLDFDSGLASVADELATLTGSHERSPEGSFSVVIESVHTNLAANLTVTPKHSVRWVVTKGTAGLGGRTQLATGGLMLFPIRWVLVDVKVESAWRALSKAEQRLAYAAVPSKDGSGLNVVRDEFVSLGDLGYSNDSVFHLYAVADDLSSGHTYLLNNPLDSRNLRLNIDIS